MIVFDANVLISLSAPQRAADLSERIAGLIEDLTAAKTVIGVPAPAWAEYLCGTDLATSALIGLLKKRSTIRILPFDEIAATELALFDQMTRAKGSKKGASSASWQKIKIDRQILAISKVHSATLIYSEDEALIVEAGRLGIPVCRTGDIPLKPEQNDLDLQPG